MASLIAAGTAYATHGDAHDPVLHLLFDVRLPAHRRPDLGARPTSSAAGSCSARPPGGPRSPARACSTTDGHSLLLASANPACVAYDPAYAFEVAHIVRDGLRRMYGSARSTTPTSEDVFYYLTIYNEPSPQPAEPDGLDGRGAAARAVPLPAPAPPTATATPAGAAAGLRRGHAVGARGPAAAGRRVGRGRGRVVGDLLERAAPRRGRAARSTNLLHPDEEPRVPYVTEAAGRRAGPGRRGLDFMRAVPDQIARWVPGDVHLARHRRLRLRRHPGRGPPLLPRGRGVDRRWRCSSSSPSAARSSRTC